MANTEVGDLRAKFMGIFQIKKSLLVFEQIFETSARAGGVFQKNWRKVNYEVASTSNVKCLI